MKSKNTNKIPCREQTHHRRMRYPKIQVRKSILKKWKQLALTYRGAEKEFFETMMKQTELIYANAVDGEITTLIHDNGLVSLLTPACLFCGILRIGEEPPLKTLRVKVTPEAYGRAQSLSRYVGLPMNMVFSIAVKVAVELSNRSVVEIKIQRHPLFFR